MVQDNHNKNNFQSEHPESEEDKPQKVEQTDKVNQWKPPTLKKLFKVVIWNKGNSLFRSDNEKFMRNVTKHGNY